MAGNKEGFLRMIASPVKFRLFLLTRLPAAFFSGVRIRRIDHTSCEVSVPYKWLTRNPFRSTYFASLSMAAEMSTGALAMASLYQSDPPVSMLVVGVESLYHKKAVARTIFICEDGKKFDEAVALAISTGESQTVRAYSKGLNSKGEPVADFYITWSFKAKTKT